jgi:hypothetical protein
VGRSYVSPVANALQERGFIRCTRGRLSRVIPSIVRSHAESQVFACTQCGATIIRTVRSGQ